MPTNMTPEEIKLITDEYNDALKRGIPISQGLADDMRDASVGIKGYTAQLKSNLSALKSAGGGLIKSIVDGETGAAVYNDTVKGAAGVLGSIVSKIPFVGKFLEGLINGAALLENQIAKQADAEFKLYQDISRNGLALGMDGAFKNLQSAGYTLKEIGQYGELMKQNSTVLATFGGTASQGVDRFAKVSKEIQNSGLQTQLMRMGKDIPGINDGIVNYIKFQQMSGSTLKQDAAQTAKSAAEFMVQQDKLTKLTGLSADEQNKMQESAMAEEQFAAKTAMLEEQKNNGATEAIKAKAAAELTRNTRILADMKAKGGPGMEKNMRMFLSGASNTEGFRIISQTMGNFAEGIEKGSTDTDALLNTARTDIIKTNKETQFQSIYGAGNAIYGPINERFKYAASAMVDSTKATESATAQQNDQTEGKDPLVKGMVDMVQNQRDSSQSAAQALHVAIPAVVDGLSKLAKVVDKTTTGLKNLIVDDTEEKPAAPAAPRPTTAATTTTSSSGSTGSSATTPANPGPDHPSPTGSPPNAAAGASANAGSGKEAGLKPDVLAKKTSLESALGQKLVVTSGVRPGAANHGDGSAIDLGFGVNKLSEADRNKLFVKALDLGFNGIGAEYTAPGGPHIHLDTSHPGLMAWGSNYKWPPTGDSPFLTQLITDRRAGKTDTKMPSAAMGGILSEQNGNSGYNSSLGDAKVPLPDGRSIPAKTTGGSSGSQTQVKLLNDELDRLDSMLSIMQKQNSISTRMLNKQK
jgi:hypothetical protein